MKLIPWQRSVLTQRTDSFFNRLFEHSFDFTFNDRLPETFRANLVPAVNIVEDDKALTVSVELPGLDEKDIDVEVVGNQLVISAERKFEEEKKDKEFHRMEHHYGTFSRTVTLPIGLQTDAVDAVYKNGILTVVMAKEEPTPVAKIEVKPG